MTALLFPLTAQGRHPSVRSRAVRDRAWVRPLFRGDMTEQGRKLMKVLTIVVNGLGNLDSILPAASALAKSHVAYGVRPIHYTPVGEALLWALERSLGSEWTPDLQSAWSAAYVTLSNFMIGEAYRGEAAAE